MRIKTFVSLSFLLFLSMPVAAEVYRWVDDRGTVNFTDNLGNIPSKYRKKATLIDQGNSGQPEVKEVVEEPKKKEAPPYAQEKQPGVKEGKKVYGDKDEDVWRKEFSRLRAEFQQTQDMIEERRKRMGDSEKLSRSQYLSLQYDINNLEKRLETLRNKLSALEEAANRVGVPADIRK